MSLRGGKRVERPDYSFSVPPDYTLLTPITKSDTDWIAQYGPFQFTSVVVKETRNRDRTSFDQMVADAKHDMRVTGPDTVLYDDDPPRVMGKETVHLYGRSEVDSGREAEGEDPLFRYDTYVVNLGGGTFLRIFFDRLTEDAKNKWTQRAVLNSFELNGHEENGAADWPPELSAPPVEDSRQPELRYGRTVEASAFSYVVPPGYRDGYSSGELDEPGAFGWTRSYMLTPATAMKLTYHSPGDYYLPVPQVVASARQNMRSLGARSIRRDTLTLHGHRTIRLRGKDDNTDFVAYAMVLGDRETLEISFQRSSDYPGLRRSHRAVLQAFTFPDEPTP